ncbi:hypothetical protein E4U17_002324 [Claviceps sp. LM77 group G4]|nr:hypothetical protein E4U17_002324 [Claviceps sp. LM77 group G4]
MTGITMETWVFDRSGPYSGATFNVHEEPEKFLQVLCGYLMMSDEELGLDILTEEKDGRRFVMIPMIHQSMCNGTDTTRAQSEARAIVSRATTCFAAKPIGAPEFDRVIKYSWIPSTWTPEADLLRKANEHCVKGIAKVVGDDREIARISKLRDGLVYRVLNTTQGPDTFGSILELLECLRDAVKVHRSLYMQSGILHGDISVNNIMITEPAKADGYKGVLIDLDLAKNMIEGPSESMHRIGTIEFMAVGVLRGEEHTYRHDLESFFYVLIWLCFVHGAKGQGTKPRNAPPDWSKGSSAQIAQR